MRTGGAINCARRGGACRSQPHGAEAPDAFVDVDTRPNIIVNTTVRRSAIRRRRRASSRPPAPRVAIRRGDRTTQLEPLAIDAPAGTDATSGSARAYSGRRGRGVV